MSYLYETEQDEILDYGDTYFIDCPYCKEESIEQIEMHNMPWGSDGEIRIECPHCKKNFEIRPKYIFKGFFIYSDDEQMEESEANNESR